MFANRRSNKTIRLLITLIVSFSLFFSAVGPSYATAFVESGNRSIQNLTPEPVSDNINRPRDYGTPELALPGDLPDKPGNTRVEIPSKRTAHSQRFQNPDGSFTEEISLEPRFYKAGPKWLPIENDLIPVNENGFKQKNKANSFETSFGDGASVRFGINGGWLTLQPVDARNVTGRPDKNRIRYDNIYDSVYIEYTVLGNRLKEDIVLERPVDRNTFSFALKTGNLQLKEVSGHLVLTNPRGETVAYFAKPFMVDATGNYSEAVTLSIRKEIGKTYLDLTADRDWLQNASYPVTIDPTVASGDPITSVHKDTFVSSTYPNTKYTDDALLYSGSHATYGRTRSFVQFVLPSLISGAKITSATFGLYQTASGSTSHILDLYRVTSFWDAYQTTWNNQPSVGAVEASLSNNAQNQYWNWDVTNLVRAWYGNTQPNYGMMILQFLRRLARRSGGHTAWRHP